MAREFLSDNIWHDPEGTGYVMLDATNDVPPQIPTTINGEVLYPKAEYHCSLVDTRAHIEDRALEEQFIEDIKRFLARHAISVTSISDERLLCREKEKTTIVAPVILDGLDDFIGFVQERIPGFQTPWTHVTLLKTAETKYGIALPTQEEVAEYCRPMDISGRPT